MKLWSRMTSVLRNLFRKQQVEEQLADEVQIYVDMLTDEEIAAGMSAAEARRTVQAKLGGVEQVKQAVRDRRAGAKLELVWQDVRFGMRQLWRNSGFTFTVVLTVALSIGINTAIFSLVNALLLRSLPYPHSERMGTIYARTTGTRPSDSLTGMDGEKWELLRDDVPSLLSAVSGGSTSGVNLQSGTHTQYLHAGRVSAHYFDVLGLHPFIGRVFSEEEDHRHGPLAAILSYSLWRKTFGSNPAILGQSVTLKGEPYTIVGVLPDHATTPINADIYTALQPSRQGEGGGTNYEAITRLRDGATWQQADAEINRAWAARAQRFVKANPGGHVTYYSVPLQKGETDVLRPQVLFLMLAAGSILLIACANLAGLTLVRMSRRTSEVATRLALGATHWQIQRQLWIENLLLALIGGAAGIGVGILALRGLLRLLPKDFLPVTSVPLDARVLAFTLGLSLLTSILFGMLPALTAGRINLRSSITSRAIISSGSLRLRQGLIASEIALAVVLLAASGLLIRTLVHLETIPPGFNPNGVTTAKASLDDARYHDPAAFRKLLSQSLLAMREIPGVRDAAVGITLPYERALNDGVTLSDGKETGQQVGTDLVYVTPGYFSTLQIPLLSGRTFTDSDGPTTQPVVLVNQTFVRKFFHGANPLGRYLEKRMIIGVVADTLISSNLNSEAAPLTGEETIYIPAYQIDDPKFLTMVHIWFQPSWAVRTDRPSSTLTAQMQNALAAADPNLPFSGFYSMNDLMAATLSTQRLEVALLSAMASLALLLSALGIFTLVANLVGQRTREIGIRIALGSTIRAAMIRIGGAGVGAAALGLILGLALSLGVLRTMKSVLYGVGVYDSPTLLAVVLVLASVTVLATAMPTLRIAAIDPAKTLREE